VTPEREAMALAFVHDTQFSSAPDGLAGGLLNEVMQERDALRCKQIELEALLVRAVQERDGLVIAAKGMLAMLDEQDDPSVGWWHQIEPEEAVLRKAVARCPVLR
jgi:hypothetical protein